MKINDLEKKAQAASEARKQLAIEADRAEAEQRRLKAEADAAIDAEDIDKYLSLKAQMERADAAYLIRKRQLEKAAAPITKEDTRAAWDDYRPGYERKLSAALATVDKKCEEFLAAYHAAVVLQEEACTTREKLGSYIGLRADVIGMGEMDSTYPLTSIPTYSGVEGITLRGPCGVFDPRLSFVLACMSDKAVELASNPKARHIITVVANRRSK